MVHFFIDSVGIDDLTRSTTHKIPAKVCRLPTKEGLARQPPCDDS